MNHEVEYHVYIGAALPIGRKPVALNEARGFQIRFGSENGGVESLKVPYLQDALLAPGKLDELARLSGCFGHRFLHENVGAGGEKIARDREVSRRGCHDAHKIDAAEQVTMVGEHLHGKFTRGLRARLGAGVDHGHELAIGRLGILLGVKAAEIADTDHRCSEFAHGGLLCSSPPSRNPCTWNPPLRTTTTICPPAA